MSAVTDSKTVLDFVLGPPLAIVAIVIGAAVVNRLARRAVRRGLAKLGGGGLRERFAGAGHGRALLDEYAPSRVKPPLEQLFRFGGRT